MPFQHQSGDPPRQQPAAVQTRMTKGSPPASSANDKSSATAGNSIPATAGTPVLARSAGATTPSKNGLGRRPSNGWGQYRNIIQSENLPGYIPRRYIVPVTFWPIPFRGTPSGWDIPSSHDKGTTLAFLFTTSPPGNYLSFQLHSSSHQAPHHYQ